MADKLDIFSRTLVKCGQRPLLSLSDARPEQRAIDRVYDSAVEKLIEGALWKFAARTDELQPSATVTSNFGYQYVYEQPEDYVRIIRICDNERLRPTLRDFMLEGEFIYADCNPLYLQYVSDDPRHGYDVGKWTPSFTDALVDELVVRTAPFLMNADVQKIEQLEKQAKRSFYVAKGRDAVNQPECWTPPGRLVRARSGGTRINNMRASGYPYY
jgi:hypothetical protein